MEPVRADGITANEPGVEQLAAQNRISAIAIRRLQHLQ
jgi:hypothetical protein